MLRNETNCATRLEARRNITLEDVLCISTSHLDSATAARLGDGDDFGIADVWRTSHGWGFLVAALEAARDEVKRFPACLSSSCDIAASLGATVLLFDADGQSVDGLRAWDW